MLSGSDNPPSVIRSFLAKTLRVGLVLIDPVIGLRGRRELAGGWYAEAALDAGGFGNASDRSWQAYAALGYRLNDRWSLLAGYRHLSIETTIDGADVDLELSGLLAGVTFAFWSP